VPIINENDTVAVEELRFGDNDRLSAEVAHLVDAHLLLLVTSSDGLVDSSGQRIIKAWNIAEVFQHVRPDKGEMSVGGMRAKLQAVDFALAHGIGTFILDGRKPGQIAAAIEGRDVGTQFPATSARSPQEKVRI
jgi:glutamate 5-kinase